MPKQQPQSEDPFFDVALPEDGKEVLGDVSGYWDPDKGAIRFKPMSVKLFDNKVDSDKFSCLVLGVLTADCMLYVNDKEEDEKVYTKHPAGTAVGVFYKPGMRGIINRCGVDCYLKQNPEKDWVDTGKPNKMKTFKLVAGDETHMIPITDDFRKDSLDYNTPFDPKGTAKKGKPSDAQGEEFNGQF